MAFAGQPGRVLSSGSDQYIHLWDLDSGQPLARFNQRASKIFMMPDGRRFIADNGRLLSEWEIPAGLAPVAGVAAVSDNKAFHGLVSTFHINDDPGNGWQLTLASRPDSKEILIANNDVYRNEFIVWNWAANKEVSRVQIPKQADGKHSILALSADGKLAAVGGDGGSLSIVNTSDGKELVQFVGHKSVVYKAAFSADSQFLVSSEAPDPKDSNKAPLILWNTRTGEVVRRLEGGSDVIWTMAVFPDGKHMICGGGAFETVSGNEKPVRCMLRMWDLETGKEIRQFIGHKNFIDSLAVSPNGKRIVSGDQDGETIIWNTDTAQVLCHLPPHVNRNGQASTTSLVFSADGTRILSGGADTDVFVSDSETGEELGRLEGHRGGITCLKVSPDGRFAISAASDRTARVWQMPGQNENGL